MCEAEDVGMQRIRFKRRFLLDLKQQQEGTEINSECDPITVLNAIIQSQENEDWYSTTEDEDDEIEMQSSQSHEEDDEEDEYPASDTFSVTDIPGLPPLKREPRLLSLPVQPQRPPGLKPTIPPPPLRAIKSHQVPIGNLESTEPELTLNGPKPPIRLFKCGKCVSIFSSQKSLTIHKLQRHMNGSTGGGHMRNGGGRPNPNRKLNGGGSVINTNGTQSTLNEYIQQQQQIPDYENDDLLLLAGMDPKDILKCTYCPRQFPNPSTLKVHMNTHTRERPYECSYCQKRFFQSSHLTVHIRTHTGEKPYQCQFCKNAFNSPSNCRVHERTHMKGNEIYQCEECNIGFLHKSRLERHLRSRKHVHPGGIVPRP